MRWSSLTLAGVTLLSLVVGIECAHNLRILLPKAKESKDFVSLKMGQAFNFLKDQEDGAAHAALDDVLEELHKLKTLIDTVDSMEEEEGEQIVLFEKLEVNVTQAAECDEKTREGDVLAVHYVAKIAATNTVVDSSFHTGSIPINVELGSEDNMPSWNEALLNMCAGERRTAGSPAEMAYGEFGLDDRVEPNTDMIFDFQLVDFQTSRDGTTKTIRPMVIEEEETPLTRAKREYEEEKARKEKERNQKELDDYAKRKLAKKEKAKEAKKDGKKVKKKKKTKSGEEL